MTEEKQAKHGEFEREPVPESQSREAQWRLSGRNTLGEELWLKY